jgi:hypothetical protein
VTVDVLFEPYGPALAGVKDAIQAEVHAGGSPLRVDVDVIRGQLSKEQPMCLLERAGLRLLTDSMGGEYDVVIVLMRVMVIGTSIDQVDTIRGRIERVLLGRGATGFTSPLTVAGMHVVDRRTSLDVLPAPTVGGGWANAALPVQLLLQPTA